MWFVGVDKLKYGCDVFPWYHEPYEYNADLEMPRNKLSFEKTVTVHTLKDLDELERLKEAPKTVLDQKEKKRNKVGGFERGVYLKKTIGRVSTGEGKVLVDSAPINAEPRISKSTDLRRYPNANESLTRIKVPVMLDRWEIHPSVRSKNIDIVLRGERKKGIWQIDVSVFEEAEQLSFFDK